MVARLTSNQKAVGSSPIWGTFAFKKNNTLSLPNFCFFSFLVEEAEETPHVLLLLRLFLHFCGCHHRK